MNVIVVIVLTHVPHVLHTRARVIGRSLDPLQDSEPVQDDLLAALLELPAQHELVGDDEDLVEVVHQVQLPHVAEIVVQDLHEEVDDLQADQLVVRGVHAQGEVQPGVPPVDDLAVLVVHKVRELLVPVRHHPVHLVLDLVLLRVGEGHVVLGEPRPALPVLEENETYHDV